MPELSEPPGVETEEETAQPRNLGPAADLTEVGGECQRREDVREQHRQIVKKNRVASDGERSQRPGDRKKLVGVGERVRAGVQKGGIEHAGGIVQARVRSPVE